MRSFEDWQMWHHVTHNWLVSAWGRTTVRVLISKANLAMWASHSEWNVPSVLPIHWKPQLCLAGLDIQQIVCANLGYVICQVQRAELFAKCVHTYWSHIIFESLMFAANQNSDRGGKTGWLLSENWCDNLTPLIWCQWICLPLHDLWPLQSDLWPSVLLASCIITVKL